MADFFECPHCQLQFKLGWLHYYGNDMGYSSRNLLVCDQCGTQHAVDVAMLQWDGGFEFEYDVVIRAVNRRNKINLMYLLRKMQSLTLAEVKQKCSEFPLVLARAIKEPDIAQWRHRFKGTGIAVDFPIVGRIAEDQAPQTRPDRVLAKAGPCFSNGDDQQELYTEVQVEAFIHDENRTIVLEKQACYHCGKTGTLVAEFDIHQDPCPHCGKAMDAPVADAMGLTTTER